MGKLDAGQKHMLKIIHRDADDDGWTEVSEQLFPVLLKTMPKELVTFEKLQDGGRAKLTDEGNNVVSAMAWL